jgi:hypothetical protein
MIECPHCRRPISPKSLFHTIRGLRCEKCALLEYVRYVVEHQRKDAA